MTAPVAALVAAATSGAVFRSTNGPQGAWTWQRRGATWRCIEGVATVEPPLRAGAWAGTASLTRVGDVVRLAVTATPTAPERSIFADGIPVGFRPSPLGMLLPTLIGEDMVAGRMNGVYPLINVTASPTVARVVYAVWVTADPWPTTLPGTPTT